MEYMLPCTSSPTQGASCDFSTSISLWNNRLHVEVVFEQIILSLLQATSAPVFSWHRRRFLDRRPFQQKLELKGPACRAAPPSPSDSTCRTSLKLQELCACRCKAHAAAAAKICGHRLRHPQSDMDTRQQAHMRLPSCTMRHPPFAISSLSVKVLPLTAPLTLPRAVLAFCTPLMASRWRGQRLQASLEPRL